MQGVLDIVEAVTKAMEFVFAIAMLMILWMQSHIPDRRQYILA